jgi:nucleoside-diphosphate-sugar epimerase
MRVVLTGGSGTIAGYVARELLAAGHELTSFGRTPPRSGELAFARGDLGDPASLAAAFAGHDAVVHLAAVTSPFRADAETLLETNVMGTMRVLDAALGAGVGTVVFASSGAATGFSFQEHTLVPRYLPLDEDHPCQPEDTYGLSKLLGEEACARWTRAHGIRTPCLRINHVWYVDRPGAELAVGSGWAKDFTLEQLWSRYRLQVLDPEGERPRLGPPRPRNLLFASSDARDMAVAFRLALEDDTVWHEVFQINGSDTCSLRETADLVAEHFRSVPLRSELPGHASLISHEKATRLLGYRPRHTWRESDFAAWLAENGLDSA